MEAFDVGDDEPGAARDESARQDLQRERVVAVLRGAAVALFSGLTPRMIN